MNANVSEERSAARPDPADGEGRSKSSLTARLRLGAAWTLFAFGASQVLRLGRNVIMTRLLAPHAYGLMAWANMVLTGIRMLSDLGTAPAIVRHPRGMEERFLNTAWTMAVIRGFCTWVVASAVAWPVSLLAGESLLCWLIPVTALSGVIGGFWSTAMQTCRRTLVLGRLNLLSLIAQVVGLAITIWWGFRLGSVWAFVAGGITAACMTFILSHTFLPGIRNRLAWDQECAREIFHFGKWIFLSTVLSFIARQGDRFVLGALVDTSILGIYSIAAGLCESFPNLAEGLSRQVAFPGLSEVSRTRSTEMRRAFYRVRRIMDAALLPFVGLLSGMAPLIVAVLYTDTYSAAGWMLRLLCIRAAARCVTAICQQCLVAAGHPEYTFRSSLARTLWTVPSLLIGWYMFGLAGILGAAAIAELPPLLVLYSGLHRWGLLNVLREVLALGAFLAGLVVGFGVETMIGMVFPEYL